MRGELQNLNNMQVSIIIPAYNEENAIGGVIKNIAGLNIPGEILVIDDGSRDNTYNNAVSAAKEFSNVKIIRHEVNRGYGAAIKTGIRNASQEIIVICDADGTYPIADIPKLVNYVENDDYDMAVGARSMQAVSIIRRPAKWLLNKLANYLVDYKIPDLNSGLRAFRKDIALKYFSLLPSGFSLTTTITLALISNNYRVKFTPISYNKRTGSSKIRPVRDTLNFLQLIIRMIVYFNPLKVFLPTSLFLFLAGGALLGFHLIKGNLGEAEVITLNTAFLILMFGFLADLISKKIV